MENRSYIEWGAIIAGAVVACAIATVLVQFGAIVGLAQTSPQLSPDANITPGFVLGTGIWLLWVQILSSMTGGYLAGRMRTPIADVNATAHESDMRDGVHGLVVWALATLMVMVAVGVVSSIAALADNPVDDAARIADVSAAQKNATVIFAFFAASTSLVSAVLSWFAATMGGNHRDSRADHSRYFTFRVIR